MLPDIIFFRPEIFLITLLLIKHHIFDFEFQSEFQFSNKGIYGHVGGLIHSLMHVFGTYICITIFSVLFLVHFSLALLLAVLLFEFIIHYHIDFFKIKITNAKKLTPNNSLFWKFLGRDQLMHNLTYIGIVIIASLQTVG